MRFLNAIPALPVRDIDQSLAFFQDKLGFTSGYHDEGFAKLQRDAAEIHLWASTDESWRERDGSSPIVSGAESFIAGTASCRIGIEGVDELYQEVLPLGIIHPNGHLDNTDFGTREFGVTDTDNNLITFFERV